ncbi:MAG: DUF4157 domain-containing protein [Jatrophihabitantaceae bacterium]
MVNRLTGARTRKPTEAFETASEDRGSGEVRPAEPVRAQLPVPVAGLALPDRTAAESGRVATAADHSGPVERVGSASDPAEAEAEATARSIVDVLRSVNPAGQPAPMLESGNDYGTVRRSAAVVGAGGGELDGDTAGELRGLRGTGRPLPPAVRRSMESAFDTDLSDVRVHTGGTAARLNASLRSSAFTAGRDIAFADGLPDTRTEDGQHLLAHELAHVLQNRGPGPIRRTMHNTKTNKDITLLELMKSATIRKAPAAIRLVLRYWETSGDQIDYDNLKDLMDQAKAEAPKMDAAFAKSLKDADELDEFEKCLVRWKKPLVTALSVALAQRRQDLANVWGSQLGPGYVLPQYVNPSHYTTPSALLSSRAQTSGRDDGAWTTTTNPLPGTGGVTTGAPNADLLLEAQSQGALFKVGSDYQQLCATCGRMTLASQFEVDHQQAFSEIRDNLIKLASAMESDAGLYQSVQSGTTDFDDLFSVTGKPGTKGCQVTAFGAVVHLYSNDMQNLMRICRSCNGPWGKSDMDMVDWFRKSPYFGQEFLDTYSLPGAQLQVIARTNLGTGWGTAAREWFANYHLPILKNQELLAHLQEMVRQRLTEQSITGIKADKENNPTKKRKLQHHTEQLGRNNEALLGGIEVERDYHNGTLLGEQPYSFAPSSPRRMQNELIEVKKKRQKRKRGDSLAKRPPYLIGRQDGCTGTATNRPDSSADQDDLDAYQLGYDEGLTVYLKAREQGASDALTANLGLDLATVNLPDPAYGAAFTEVFQKRVQAWWDGKNAFTHDIGLDFDYATGDPHAQRLLRDYMLGYEYARQEAKNSVTGSQTPDPQLAMQ